MTQNEKFEKIAEQVYAKFTNSMLKQLSDKYKEMLEDKTAWEMDKKNDEIQKEYPEYGAVAVVMDGGTELSFPFNTDSVVKIIDGETVHEFVVNDGISIKDIADAIKNAKEDVIGVETYTNKELEFYDKDKLYNEDTKLKYTKVYKKTFSAYYPKHKVCAVYKVAGTLE